MTLLTGILAGANCGNSWTPARISGLLFWLQAPRVGSTENLTIVGGKVSAAADAGGGATVLSQAVAGRRPIFDGVEFADGHTCIETNFAADTELASPTGGLTGDVAHTLVTIGAYTSTPAYQASNQGMMQFGPAAPSASSVLGNNNTGANGQYWGGGGPATGTPGGGDIISGKVEFVHKTYSPAPSEIVYLDGVQVASGVNALPITNAAIIMGSTFANPAFANPNYKILTRLWISGVISAADLALLYQWARLEYPESFPNTYGFLGDSNTFGSGPVTPSDTFGYLLTQARATRQWQTATAGWTSADGLAALPALLATKGLYRVPMFHSMLGTNDINTSVPVATTKANYESIADTIRASCPEATIIFSTILPSLVFNTPQKLADWAELNAYITAAASGKWQVNPAATYPGLDDYLSANYQGDGVHLSVAGQQLFETLLAQTYPG